MDEPDKSNFADKPFSGDDSSLNGTSNMLQRQKEESSNIVQERSKAISEMVTNMIGSADS